MTGKPPRAGRLCAAAIALVLAVVPAGADTFHRRIQQRDQTRIKNWRRTWVEAVSQARAAGFGAQIDQEGVLLQPDAALERPTPPEGLYRCRTLKLGRPTLPNPDPSPLFRSLPDGRCRIADGALHMLEGAQRVSGTLYPDSGGLRLDFLGGMSLSDEAVEARYGRDAQRSLAGFLERIGPARWRLVLPQPPWENRLQVIEIVPATD